MEHRRQELGREGALLGGGQAFECLMQSLLLCHGIGERDSTDSRRKVEKPKHAASSKSGELTYLSVKCLYTLAVGQRVPVSE
jgi:hypothetical protein